MEKLRGRYLEAALAFILLSVQQSSSILSDVDILRMCRQGDPGSTRYFLSLEDNMFRIFGGDRIKSMMSMFQIDDLPIESGLLVSCLRLLPQLHLPSGCGLAHCDNFESCFKAWIAAAVV